MHQAAFRWGTRRHRGVVHNTATPTLADWASGHVPIGIDTRRNARTVIRDTVHEFGPFERRYCDRHSPVRSAEEPRMTTDSRPTARDGQVEYADGRIELENTAVLVDPALANDDLAPVPVAERTWNTYNYTALWVGMSHNIPSWLLASGLVAAGMSWQQAVFIILLANVIVLIPILLNGHGGTKYGIPFPVLARSSFGVFGANLPALIRALAATCWFGVQSWSGGVGIFLLAG
jgi:hypothetical protein